MYNVDPMATQGLQNDMNRSKAIYDAIAGGGDVLQALGMGSGGAGNVNVLNMLLNAANQVKATNPNVDLSGFNNRYVNPMMNSNNVDVWSAVTDYLTNQATQNTNMGTPTLSLLNRLSQPITNSDALDAVGSAVGQMGGAFRNDKGYQSWFNNTFQPRYGTNMQGATPEMLSAMMQAYAPMADVSGVRQLAMPNYQNSSPLVRNMMKNFADNIYSQRGQMVGGQGVIEDPLSVVKQALAGVKTYSERAPLMGGSAGTFSTKTAPTIDKGLLSKITAASKKYKDLASFSKDLDRQKSAMDPAYYKAAKSWIAQQKNKKLTIK